MAIRELQHRRVLDRAGRNECHAARAIVCAHVAVEIVAGEGADRLLVAEDRPAHRLVRIHRCLQVIENDVVRRVVRLPDLLQHDLALAFEFAGVEGGMSQDVGQKVDGEGHVGREHPCMESGLLAARVGIEGTADGFDFLCDAAGRSPFRALECHVFEHVRNAHPGFALMAGAAVHPYAQTRALELRHWIRSDRQAVGKTCDFNIHGVPTGPR